MRKTDNLLISDLAADVKNIIASIIGLVFSDFIYRLKTGMCVYMLHTIFTCTLKQKRGRGGLYIYK